MFLDFEKGHWLTIYRTALREEVPPPEMRVHMKSRPAGTDLPDDVPNHAGYSLKFMAKLFGTRIAMLLRKNVPPKSTKASGEGTFAMAWAEGRNMAPEVAIAETLG